MSIEAIRELKTLASVCPELNMANYTEDDVRHLNDWAIEMSLLVEQYALSQQPATGEPVAQWQKRHPVRTAGRWQSTDEHDAKWWHENAKGWEVRALYDRPEPSVPDEKPLPDLMMASYHEAIGWNACRAAMIAAAPATHQDMS